MHSSICLSMCYAYTLSVTKFLHTLSMDFGLVVWITDTSRVSAPIARSIWGKISVSGIEFHLFGELLHTNLRNFL